MSTVINNQTGLAEELDPQAAQQALQAGTHDVPLISPQGVPGSAPMGEASNLLSQGYKQPSSDQLNSLHEAAKYKSGNEPTKAYLEGVGSGSTFGLSTGAERLLGVNPEDIRKRREYNPTERGAGEAVGLGASMLMGTGEAKILGAAGEGAAGLVAKFGAGRFGQAAVKQAAEMALLQGGDEISKLMASDPDQSVSSALSNIGMSSAAGAVLGLGGEGAKSLWNATVGDKVGQMVSDFRGRMGYHLTNPEPVEAITSELQQHYKNVTDMADEVYGASGLKARDIAKSVPEINDKILQQSVDVNDNLSDLVNKMKKIPELYPPRLAAKAENDLQRYQMAINEGNQDPTKIYNAIQDLKQTFQGYSKFGKMVSPVDEGYDFIQKARGMGNDLKTALEDTGVWGNAAKRQVQINKAFTEFLPALKDFNKRFTTEVGEEKVVDPGKINTYVNQLGKPNSELKQEMLQNFLDASDRYRNTISKTHENLGLEAPFQPTSLATTKASLQELTPGAKLADTFVKNGVGATAGATVGGALGTAVGHPVLGSIVGTKALAPFFDSVLPTIAKSILAKDVDSVALKTAVDHGYNVVKGTEALKKAARNVISLSGDVLPNSLLPKEKGIERLDRMVHEIQVDPTKLAKTSSKLSYYMPDHAVQMVSTMGRSLNYLQSLRPSTSPIHPLDMKIEPSQVDIGKYQRALAITEQPLMILKHLNEGTLVPQDITTITATHPALYNAMKQHLIAALMDHKADGGTLPYATTLGLSLFLGQPLDSSTVPQNMLINQQVGQAMVAQKQAQGEAAKGPKSSFKSTASMAQSASQASEADKSQSKG